MDPLSCSQAELLAPSPDENATLHVLPWPQELGYTVHMALPGCPIYSLLFKSNYFRTEQL